MMAYKYENSSTSIGCGTMIDYWSLERVVGSHSMIRYKGIDPIDWYYTFPIRETDSAIRFRGNAIDFFRQEELSSDIYIFPKSISEFSESDIRALMSFFTAESILKDKVHFFFSLRIGSGSALRDCAKTTIIYNRMIQCGFHTDDQDRRYYTINHPESEKKIREVDGDFLHPGEVVDCLKELYVKCARFHTCSKKAICEKKLGRWPILKCNQAAWQLFTFER